MNFEDYLKTSADQINRELEVFFESLIKDIRRINPDLLRLLNIAIDASYGGKRLRGTLVILGYELVDNHHNNEVLKPAIAYEILQTAVLTHDDVIDLSPTRRGRPTVYQALGGNHYGISQAIVLGDLGLFLAVKLIIEAGFEDTVKNQALQYYIDNILKTLLGEALDVELPMLRKRTEKDVITIHRLKTAYYTIIGPMQLGAMMGGADQTLLNNIKVFGENLGIAFQIQDDILGVFGDEESLGKSVTSDIEEGKNTLLVTQALKKASPAQREILDKYYGRGNVGSRGLIAVRQVFVSTGSLDYSRQQALKYVSQAKKIIPRISQSAKYARLLSEMADFLVQRDR